MTLEKGYTIPVLDHGFVRYIDHMGNDQRICEAARISYRSPSKGEEQDKKLIDYLYKNKHTSPFEMVKVTLNIKLPIFVMRQYVRLWMQNLNEVSARYSELPGEFYIPAKWRAQDLKNKQSSREDGLSDGFDHQEASRQFLEECRRAYRTYQSLLQHGVAREMARLILPVTIYTEIYACWDLKNLLHFITLREDTHAQWEHQQYGKAIKQIAVELFPWTMEAYEKYKSQ
jgi:thymidylate synthase (FAD)